VVLCAPCAAEQASKEVGKWYGREPTSGSTKTAEGSSRPCAHQSGQHDGRTGCLDIARASKTPLTSNRRMARILRGLSGPRRLLRCEKGRKESWKRGAPSLEIINVCDVVQKVPQRGWSRSMRSSANGQAPRSESCTVCRFDSYGTLPRLFPKSWRLGALQPCDNLMAPWYRGDEGTGGVLTVEGRYEAACGQVLIYNQRTGGRIAAEERTRLQFLVTTKLKAGHGLASRRPVASPVVGLGHRRQLGVGATFHFTWQRLTRKTKPSRGRPRLIRHSQSGRGPVSSA